MSAIPNNVRDAIKKTNDRFAKARSDQGYGGLGPWPGEELGDKGSAEYLCDVTIVPTFENVVFKYGKAGVGAGEQSRPAYRVQFQYVATQKIENGQYTPMPEAFAFPGIPLTIPFDVEGLPGKGAAEGNASWRASQAEEILKGHLEGFLNYTCNDPLQALEDAINLNKKAVDSNTKVQCRVFLHFSSYTVKNGDNKGQKNIQKQDHIRERLSN